ncbi:MAG TPA: hypothetical protein VIO94_15790 [Phenylobacterium sp.]
MHPASENQKAVKAGKHPAKIVDALYILTEQLDNAARVLEGTYAHAGLWRDLAPDRAAQLEAMLGGFDFLMTAKAVRAYADAWQAEIDAEDDRAALSKEQGDA